MECNKWWDLRFLFSDFRYIVRILRIHLISKSEGTARVGPTHKRDARRNDDEELFQRKCFLKRFVDPFLRIECRILVRDHKMLRVPFHHFLCGIDFVLFISVGRFSSAEWWPCCAMYHTIMPLLVRCSIRRAIVSSFNFPFVHTLSACLLSLTPSVLFCMWSALTKGKWMKLQVTIVKWNKSCRYKHIKSASFIFGQKEREWEGEKAQRHQMGR